MARFARDVLRMKAEVMCSKYQDETLIKASGIMYTADAQLVPQALQLLRNETMRNFNIDIETDTLVLIDQQQDKQERIEFLTAVGGFLKQAVDAGKSNPTLAPLLGDMLLFGIRGFKIGRTLEGDFEQYIERAKQAQGQQQPSPEQIKAQADMQAKQAELQMEQAKIQAEQQLEQAKIQAEQQLETQKLQFEQWRVQLENDTKVMIAELNAKNAIKQKVIDIQGKTEQEGLMELNENGDLVPNVSLTQLVDSINQNMKLLMDVQNANHQQVLERQSSIADLMTRPKQVVRDPNTGKIIGVK